MHVDLHTSDAVEDKPGATNLVDKYTLSRFSYPKETWIAIPAAVGIATYLLCKYAIPTTASYSHWILIAVLAIGGVPLVIDLIRKGLHGEFGSDLLAGFSIVTSAIIGEYPSSS